jgi:hypothetical protein
MLKRVEQYLISSYVCIRDAYSSYVYLHLLLYKYRPIDYNTYAVRYRI